MKKLLSVVLCLLMVAALLPLDLHPAKAEETSGQCGDDLYWEFDKSTGTLTITGSGEMWDYSMGSAPWFSGNMIYSRMKTIHLSEGVTSIGSCAFYARDESCDWYPTADLTTVILPDSLQRIGDAAFTYCVKLQSVIIPDSVTDIGRSAFAWCSSLEEVVISNNLTTIPAGLFYHDSKIKSIIIPDGVTIIESEAFYNTGLTSITIPDHVTTIARDAFYCDFSNPSLADITLGNGIESIGEDAFYGQKNLKAVNYHGTKQMRECIQIDSGNSYLTDLNWHYLTVNQIEWKSLPDKLEYLEGEALDVTGGIIMAYYDYNIVEEEPLTAEMVSGFHATAVGTQTLTVTFEGKTTTYEVTVFHVHTPGDPVHENEVAPTFTEEGHYDEVVYCTVCHAELSRETVSTGRLPFEGTITWNEADVKFRGTTPYVVANGQAQTPRFTVKCADGTIVDPRDYDFEYRENTKAGTGYVFVTLKGDYTGSCRGAFKIYLPSTAATYVENTPYAIKLTWTPVEGAAGYVIYRRAWSTTTNGWTAFSRWDNTTQTTYYDGHDDSHKVYAGTRYQYGVKAYFERRTDPVTGAEIGGNVGDNYNLGEVGPLKTTVRITSRELLTLTAGSNQITAEWSGSKNFTGYQIKYATDADFKQNMKSVKITSPSTYSTVIKSLKSGTLYYVTVRSYHEFGGMTYFGAWSNVLCVKPGSGMIVSPTHYRALLIGNNNYSSSPLYGCINDVNAMSGMLHRLSMPYTGTVVKNARRETIISQIRSTFAGATDSDVSLFYYSGHGVNAGGSGVNQGALVGVDGKYITMKELAAELSKFRGRVIVILDSCHSGASIGKSDNTIDALDAFNREVIEAFSGYELETGDTAYSAKSGELKQSKFIVLTAASMSQSSWDGSFDGSGYRQGAFTAAIVKGMGFAYPNGGYAVPLCFPADTNGDRKVTLKELYTYTYNTAYNWTYKSGSPQRAQYYGNDSEVVFSR